MNPVMDYYEKNSQGIKRVPVGGGTSPVTSPAGPTSSGPFLDPTMTRLYFWKRFTDGIAAGLTVPSWRDFPSDRAAWQWATDGKAKRDRFPVAHYRVVDPTFQKTDRGF